MSHEQVAATLVAARFTVVSQRSFVFGLNHLYIARAE